MSTLGDIETALINAGAGVAYDGSTDWGIVVGYMQDSPDRMIMIKEFPGQRPDTNWSTRFPELQVIIRGDQWDYAGTETKAQAVFDALHANPTAEATGDGFVYIQSQTSSYLFQGYDENRRPWFAYRFEIARD